jgi:hypothetical protein
MRCEACQGMGFVPTHTVVSEDQKYAVAYLVCTECYGSGIAYCCDEAGANPPNMNEAPCQNAHTE